MAKQETKKVVDSEVRVKLPVTQTEKPVLVRRRLTSETIANDIASRITGKLIGWGDLYNPKTQQFLTEAELVAKGAVFVTISFDKVLGKNDTLTKSRITKEPTPFIRKTSKYQVIANIDWQSYINRRSDHGDFTASEKRTNGVENYENCRAVGKTKAGNFTLNGVAFRVLEQTKYFESNGKEYDKKYLTEHFLKTQSKASKTKEAAKHGIDVKFDPKYRTTRIDSCGYVRGFGFEYIPSDNPVNK